MKVYMYLFMMMFLSGCGCSVVDTGERGIETNFGKIVGEPLTEGIHFYNPLTSSVTKMDVREQKTSSKTTTYTKDIQTATIEFSINYVPNAAKMAHFYAQYGQEWAEKVVPQVTLSSIKGVLGKYDAVDLIKNRQRANQEVEDMIKDELAKVDVSVTQFQITNIDFNDTYEKAVEAKVVATQKAEEAKNKTVEVEEYAKQQLIKAEAEAKSMRIRAEALEKNKNLVEYESVQKWDGKLPVYMMGGSVPFINLSPKDQK